MAAANEGTNLRCNAVTRILVAASRCQAAVVMHAQIVTLERYDALHAHICGVTPTMVDLGITTAFNHVAIQQFVASLKPALWDKMMKARSGLKGRFSTSYYP
jgi:hypothetical protein